MSVPLKEISGGGKAWSPEAVGDQIAGTITVVERRQQTDFTTGEPLTWSDGRPRMLTYIELQTDLQESDDDEGLRALYAKGGNFEAAQGSGLALENAIVEAAKKAGAAALESGAKLQVAMTGLAKPTTRGYQPAKLYKAEYTAPVSKVELDDVFAD